MTSVTVGRGCAYCGRVTRHPLPPLALSQSVVDRAAAQRTRVDLLAAPGARVLHLRGDHVPTLDGALTLRAPDPADADLPLVYLGDDDGAPVVAVLDEAPADRPADAPAGAAPDAGAQAVMSLRTLAPHLDAHDMGLVVTAVAMANWHAVTRFCARCGEPLHPEQAGWLLACPRGHHAYPATSPAVIMAVVDDDDRLLLARGAAWPAPNASVLAGFVEPGESLEAAVAREVREEVGVEVTDVRYEGNQPWPFPASLMIGFSCRARGTDLHLDAAEIAEARWYTRDELAEAARAGEVSLPPALSIAHHLVGQWYGDVPPGARP